MTRSLAAELTHRQATPDPSAWTFLDAFEPKLRKLIERTLHIRFPNPKYQEDPAGFFRDILGVEPWSRQIEIMEAVRDHDRVAVCSGHKVSKSHTAAGIALWYFCSFPDARVVMTSVTSRQVDQILWREVRMLRARAGRCVVCKLEDPLGLTIPRPCEHSTLIPEEPGELARTGIKSADFREIVGFTAKEAEAVAGISGRSLLYIADEASGIGDDIFAAIEGNRAGGAKLLMLSNGTRNQGVFFEAFTTKARYYHTIRVSSEETPNVIQGRMVIPGLATREWVEEKRQEWGESSPLYRIRVLGQFALADEAKIFSVHAIAMAEARWAGTPEAGRLYIGLDPAGETGLGDDTCFAPRRGLKVLELRALRGLNDEQHLVQLLMLLDQYRLPRETPVVVLDREGRIGTNLRARLTSYLDQHPSAFELVCVRASDRALRRGDVYDRMRDALCANLDAWLRDGGAIPEDAKLSAELHALEWTQAVNGKLKVTPKDKLRRELQRSPDRYDAVTLSVWEPLSLQDPRTTAERVAIDAGDSTAHQYSEQTMDPYAGGEWWKR